MATTTTTQKKTRGKTPKKAPAKDTNTPAKTLPLYEEAWLAFLGLIDLVGEEFGDFEKKLVLRGKKRNTLLKRQAKKVRKNAEKRVDEIKEEVEEEYHKVLDKVGLGEAV